jgi:D-glycero-alpha-D-manno-heptose-7-phosphate kinase
LFDYSVRLAYSRVECVSSPDQIQHGPFRECLKFCGIERDIELNYVGELPSFSGLGTSSSFVVGLLNALHNFQGRQKTPLELAYEAIHVERNLLGECVGCQDQAFAALGGFNVIEFRPSGEIVPHEIPLSQARKSELQNHMMLFDTRIRRRAADVASHHADQTRDKVRLLTAMRNQVDEGYRILTGTGPISGFGDLLHEAWQLKLSLDERVGPPQVRQMYERAKDAGALGGKLLGAGGGGFLLLFAPPERQGAIRETMAGHAEVDVSIDAPGSHRLFGEAAGAM